MNRKVYLDFLRILACFLVIVNHTNSDIFLNSSIGITWFVSITYFFICKIAVPLFVMISGAVLLGKKDSYKKILKRVYRIILVLILFSFVYYIDIINTTNQEINFLEFLKMIFQQHITNAYWYLYLYLGLLIMLPILQRMVSAFSYNDYIYFFVITFLISGVWPILVHYNNSFSYSNLVVLPIFNAYIGMFVAGYFLDSKCNITSKKIHFAIILFICCIVLSIIGSYFEYMKDSTNYLFYDNQEFFTIVVPAMSAFAVAKYLFFKMKINRKMIKVINFLGKCTFVMYLLSDLIIIKTWWIYSDLLSIFHSTISMVIYELVVFLICLALACILKKIPLLRKII